MHILIVLILADHWQDVVVGSIVGTVFSYFVYRLYYPALGSRISNLPYAPRTQRESDQEELPTHMVCLSLILFLVSKLNA